MTSFRLITHHTIEIMDVIRDEGKIYQYGTEKAPQLLHHELLFVYPMQAPLDVYIF